MKFILNIKLIQAALDCGNFFPYKKVDMIGSSIYICEDVISAVECFSKINKTECFASDIYAQLWKAFPSNLGWTNLLSNINLCGNVSKQDLAEIGCLYGKHLYYAQQCGIMELDDCE